MCRGFLKLEGLRLQGACIQRHQRQGMGEGVVSLRGYRIRKLLIIQVVAKGPAWSLAASVIAYSSL